MICVPTMLRISVVLPQPDGPSRPVIVPRAICTVTSSSAMRFPRMTRRLLDVDRDVNTVSQ